jgi:hypothetical protein
MAEPIVRTFVIDTTQAEQNLTSLGTTTKATTSIVDSLYAELIRLDSALNELSPNDEQFQTLATQIKAVEESITSIETGKFSDIATGIEAVDSANLVDLQNSIDSLNGGDLSNVADNIENINEAVATLDSSNIAAVQTDLDNIDTKTLSTASTDIESINESIATIDSGNIEQLQSSFNEIDTSQSTQNLNELSNQIGATSQTINDASQSFNVDTNESEQNLEELNAKVKDLGDDLKELPNDLSLPPDSLDKAGDSLDNIGDKAENAKDKLDDSAQSAKKLGENAKGAESGFKKVGSTLNGLAKATGVVALLTAAFNTVKSVIQSTQPIADAFSAAFGTFTDIIRDAFTYITDNAGTVVEYFEAIFNDPVQALKDFGDAIVDNLIERFNSFVDTLGFVAEGIKNLFTGEFDAALESFKNAGKESIDVLTGVDDTVNRVTDAVVEGAAAFGKYVSETFKANEELVRLQNNAKLAAAQQARLAEQYDRQAELLRQTRDDESKSIQDRINANTELGEVLAKQEQAELASAQAQVAAAQATFEHNKTIDNQVALTQALAGVDGVRAKIAGLKSEQLVNEIALNKELNELTKAQVQSNAELAIADAKFTADSIKNDLDRLNAQRAVLEEEQNIALAALQTEIDKYNTGTQARLDAEIAYAQKKQEIDQSLESNAIAIADAELARANELNTLRIQNDLTGFDERLALLELEYAEKERLAFGDSEKIVELEREKQDKIRQLNAETFAANLEFAEQGLSALQGFLDASFTKQQNELKVAQDAELLAFEESYATRFATVEEGSEAEKKLTETAQKEKEKILKRNEKKQIEFAKKQFEAQKKMQLAGAVIDAAKAINASLASAPVAIGPIPNPAGIASLALATITGAASVAKIAATKFESPAVAGDIPTGGVAAGGSEGGGANSEPAQFNPLAASFLENRPEQMTPRAYVLAGDVASQQEVREKVQDLARIG